MTYQFHCNNRVEQADSVKLRTQEAGGDPAKLPPRVCGARIRYVEAGEVSCPGCGRKYLVRPPPPSWAPKPEK